MLVHIALGGNALLRRGETMTPENQRENVRIAAQAIAPVAAKHDVVIGHGNGPQGGRRAPQRAGTNRAGADALGARGEGRIGYMIEQELGNLLPSERPFATLLTMVEVDPDDPAFAHPTKFIGPVYERAEAQRLAGEYPWVFKRDGDKWRRVVASPEPKRIVEVRPIKWLLDRHTVVIAADGGGIPTMYVPGAKRKLTGVECVVEKDFASELLARELGADLYVMLTDAEAVYADWGKPAQRAIRRVSPKVLESMQFAEGSMGPKVAAACRFAIATGRRAAIGALADLEKIVTGQAGTIVTNEESGIVYHGAGPLPSAGAAMIN